VNNGKATYAGIEGEGTYSLSQIPGLSLFANGALMSSKQQNGLWEPNAPYFTFAAGMLYNHNNWKLGLVLKTVGQQYSDSNDLKVYEMPPYTNINTTVGYTFGMFDLTLNLDNLLNERKLILISEETAGVNETGAASTDQYFYQSPRSVMLTLKAHI
jgi:outer membrane receptor protein involved in Fe transport